MDPSKCFFVDDSRINVLAAHKFGWGHCVHFCESGLEAVEGGRMEEIGLNKDIPKGITVITRLEELRIVWKEVFKQE